MLSESVIMIGKLFSWLFGPTVVERVIVQEVVKEVIKEVPVVTTNGEATHDPLAVYSQPEMEIYSYFNGHEMIRVDPMVLFKRFAEVAAEIDADIKGARTPGLKNANQLYDDALRKIRGVFDVKTFEEGGLTEVATFSLLDHYLRFNAESKKNLNGTATLSPTLVTPDLSSPNDPPTASSTD